VRNEPTVCSSIIEVRFDIEHLLEIEDFAKFRSVSFVAVAENRLLLVPKFVMWWRVMIAKLPSTCRTVV